MELQIETDDKITKVYEYVLKENKKLVDETIRLKGDIDCVFGDINKTYQYNEERRNALECNLKAHINEQVSNILKQIQEENEFLKEKTKQLEEKITNLISNKL